MIEEFAGEAAITQLVASREREEDEDNLDRNENDGFRPGLSA